MRSMAATRRSIGAFALLSAVGWAGQAQAQFGGGTTWLRTDAHGKGIILSVEACCNGGLRLIWQIPSMGGQPASTMTVKSPTNGTARHRRDRSSGRTVTPHWRRDPCRYQSPSEALAIRAAAQG